MYNSLAPLKMKGGLSVFSFMLLIYILFLILATIFPPLRYAKYLLPFFAAIDFLIFKRFRKSKTYFFREYFQPHLFLYFFLVLCSFVVCLIKGVFTDNEVFIRFFEEAYFILTPLVFVSIIYFVYDPNQRNQYVKYIFWGLLISYIFEKGSTLPGLLANPSSFSSSLVDRPTESGAGFALGLVFLYFVFNGKIIYSIITLLFTILSFKRIALVGIIISGALYLLLSKTNFQIHRYKNFISALLMLINFILVHLVIQVAYGNYDALIHDYTGLSANAFLMGRQYLYSEVLKAVGQESWFGVGLGKTWTVISGLDFSATKNLHSDILKNFLELGNVLFLLWSFLIYRLNTKTIKMFVLAFYVNILFFTDNVIIYFDVMFVFYLLQGILLSENL